MSSNKAAKKPGVDSMLNAKGRSLAVGQEIRFQLIKGASGIQSADPLNSKAPPEAFPVVAKFAESVVKPNFSQFVRFYQQDIPSKKDDSDDESMQQQQQPVRKKRKYRRNEGPRRQWLLQENEDFIETQIAQQEQGKLYKQDQNVRSTRYEGIPEHNPSQYVLIGVSKTEEKLQVITLPTPHAVNNFSQPAKTQTLSMSEAEQAIENQRSHMTRYMMHNKTSQPNQPQASSKARLMGKLKKLASNSNAADDDGDDDDVMGDLKFTTRKGGGSRARKELLSTLADGVAMDADGVLGGANDSEFGGKRRFMKMEIKNTEKKPLERSTGKGASSNDGMAMADDFYQRDVKAEYEELDYDANEQFDDDDVDHGEGDVTMEGGFQEDLGDDDDDDEAAEEDEDDEKKAGLATIKGLRDMLAKARGEVTADVAKEGEKKEDDDDRSGNSSPINVTSPNEEKEAEEEKEAIKPPIAGGIPKEGGYVDPTTGERILSMESVRYEIFLHNKSISMKKLMKLYNIKKKSSQDRIKKFQHIIKELCLMNKDPVEGNMLVLKQHYGKGI
mmetsp:Transcript_10741/g.16468  ORF Transcript_10741/g.16468 Transcript_10741/m.16468 type:complete len:557 (+) Transcript_10741:260-1930(+)